MSVAAAPIQAGAGWPRIGLARFGDAMLFLGVASGSVVMIEPAPYDLILVAMGLFAFVLGLRIPRAMGPLLVLLLLFQVGGLLVMTQPLLETEKSPQFVAISLFLAFTCIFFAATVADRPQRIELIVRAMILAALIAAVLGIMGYLFHIESLTRYDRAKGAFKDPNVFGPFMMLPLLVLAREFLTRPFGQVWWKAGPILVILVGVLFSFSRAAWFLAVFGLVLLAFVVFLNERSVKGRLRLIGIAAAGAAAVVLVLVAILADETTREFLMNRAKLVQDYDGARLGRLARHLIGFLWVTELPLGLGPLDFGYYYGEDPHNVYLKGFLAYGWLGGLSYLVLVFWTIGALFPLMFKPRPWQPYAQVVWVCLIGHLIVGWIIDSDHWRHFFMLWGLAWGMVALEAAHRRRMARTLPGQPVIGAFEAART